MYMSNGYSDSPEQNVYMYIIPTRRVNEVNPEDRNFKPYYIVTCYCEVSLAM
jgi:hypothetical protein